MRPVRLWINIFIRDYLNSSTKLSASLTMSQYTEYVMSRNIPKDNVFVLVQEGTFKSSTFNGLMSGTMKIIICSKSVHAIYSLYPRVIKKCTYIYYYPTM